MLDTILHSGAILTMDDGSPTATAIALRDGRVLAVGSDEILALRRDATEMIDLRGRTVCPGFIDAHHHITLAANLSGEIGVLKPGGRADCVILSANLLETPPERFDTIRVERTILGGNTVYLID